MIKIRRLFYNSMLPVFMGPNKLFQRKDPCVFVLRSRIPIFDKPYWKFCEHL